MYDLLRVASLLAHCLAERQWRLRSDSGIRMQEAGWVTVTELRVCFFYYLSMTDPVLNTDS